MDNVIDKHYMLCPICGKEHEVEEYSQTVYQQIKGFTVPYEEHFLHCTNIRAGENNFIPAAMFTKNLLAAQNAYRAIHGFPPIQSWAELKTEN